MPTKIHDAEPSMDAPLAVDNTDWLKTAAIILVVVDHVGYFFIEDYEWWSVFGRWAAPPFFFLLGYAQSRAVPLSWIWLGIILTLLDSWNTDWTWVPPNILLSFALIRLARPHVQSLLERYGWPAFTLLVCALIAVLASAAIVVDYGSEGWLVALFGLIQRMHVDRQSAAAPNRVSQSSMSPQREVAANVGLMRLLVCFVAMLVYIWQEQLEFSFTPIQFVVFALGMGVLSLALFHFRRGRSRIQPPDAIAPALRFIGRRTLEIYAVQLAGSELVILLFPGLEA